MVRQEWILAVAMAVAVAMRVVLGV
jgi:hypothetical protein